MRVVQLANFWTPTSGGLRTVLEHLAAGYAERGHRVLQVVPGRRDEQQLTSWGRRTTVAAPTIPGAGGYRVILRLRHVQRLLAAHQPEVIEVSDRATLAHLAGRWHGTATRVVLVAHERLDRIIGAGSYGSWGTAARLGSDRWNPRCGDRADRVVVPSDFAAEEWRRVGVEPDVVPWGVDHAVFRPDAGAPAPARGPIRICWVGRLSPEKRPQLALDALRALRDLGVDADLTIVGDGPDRADLEASAVALPVHFVGHVTAARVASELARSTVTLSTSGIETFGLTVAESLACGTPTVCVEGGAAGEVAGHAGRVCAARPSALAAAVLDVAADDSVRQRARRRGRQFTWDRTLDRMADLHSEVHAA